MSSPPPRTSQMPSSPAGSTRVIRTRRPPAKYGDWDFSSELSGESNPSPMGRHLGGDSEEEEEEEEESDSEDTSDSDCVEGGVNGEGGGDVTRDIEINDREGRVGEQERGEAESDGEDSDRDTEVSIIQRSERVREDNRNEDSDTEVIVENVQAVLPPDPPPLPAGQPHGHDGHDGEPLLGEHSSGFN